MIPGSIFGTFSENVGTKRTPFSSWGSYFHFRMGVYLLTYQDFKVGAQVSLSRPKEGKEITNSLIDQYCTPRTHKASGKIPINKVMDLALRADLFTIA